MSRWRIEARVDDGIGEASANVTVMCKDGRTMHVFVEHALGSLQRPMSDAELARKFHGLVDPVLDTARADRLLDQCATLASAADVRALTALARA